MEILQWNATRLSFNSLHGIQSPYKDYNLVSAHFAPSIPIYSSRDSCGFPKIPIFSYISVLSHAVFSLEHCSYMCLLCNFLSDLSSNATHSSSLFPLEALGTISPMLPEIHFNYKHGHNVL